MYRLATILSCASIVVTAVYILRAAGKSIMGPIVNKEHLSLGDATWNEKTAAVLLLSGIVVIGIAPFWLQDLIHADVNGLMVNIGRNLIP